MNFTLNFLKHKIAVFCFTIYLVVLLFFPTPQKAQVKQNVINNDIQYKFRDNNRWEGVRSKEIKEVSSALELASLIYYHEVSKRKIAREDVNLISIYFNSPIEKDVMVSIFNLGEKYFMEPHPKNFNKLLWNQFDWPNSILNLLSLNIKDLQGIASTRFENKKIYLPVYFIPPEKIDRKNYTLEFSLYAGRGMYADIEIYAKGVKAPAKKWNDIKLLKYQLKTLRWNVDSNFYDINMFRIVVTEKTEKTARLIDEFNIYIAK